jgi:hypothetical protein
MQLSNASIQKERCLKSCYLIQRSGCRQQGKVVCTSIKGLQEHHIKPAIALWLAPPSSDTSDMAEREAALRNLTAAGVPVVVPAGFVAAGSVADCGDACSDLLAASPLSLTVSTSTSENTVASGVQLSVCVA